MISKVHMRKPVARASWEEESRVIYTPARKVIFPLRAVQCLSLGLVLPKGPGKQAEYSHD